MKLASKVNEKVPQLRDLCDPDWIQTNDLLLRRQLLYSTELPDQKSDKNFKVIQPRPSRLEIGMLYSTELPDQKSDKN